MASCLLNSTISRLISVSDTHRNRCRLSITTLVSWKSGEWLTLNFFKAHQPYRVLASMTTFQVLLRYDGFYHGKLIVRHSLARVHVYCVTYQLQKPGTSNHHLKSCKINYMQPLSNVGASTSKQVLPALSSGLWKVHLLRSPGAFSQNVGKIIFWTQVGNR